MSRVVGRDRELAEIASFLELGDGAPRILLIEGEPGIGKTTLWSAGVDEARRQGYRVLLCTASRSETHLSFTGLRDLLEAGFDDVANELPTPQRRALDVVLLREEPTGRPLDEGAVATAVTSTLRLFASRAPTLVAVDDLQWVDRPSALALAFAARRVDAAPVRFLLARRERADTAASVTWVEDPARTSLIR